VLFYIYFGLKHWRDNGKKFILKGRTHEMQEPKKLDLWLSKAPFEKERKDCFIPERGMV